MYMYMCIFLLRMYISFSLYRRRPAGEYRRPLPFRDFLEERFQRKLKKTCLKRWKL